MGFTQPWEMTVTYKESRRLLTSVEVSVFMLVGIVLLSCEHFVGGAICVLFSLAMVGASSDEKKSANAADLPM